MELKKEDLAYYFITDSTDNSVTDKHVLETVRKALEGGARIVQYREKSLPYQERLHIAKQIRVLTADYGALFIVNDDVKLAAEVDADGVHVGQKDASYEEARSSVGERKIVGVSATTYEEALEAAKAGADYIGIGPIFTSTTKKDADPPCGLETITKTRKALPLMPIVAIGGINIQNYQDVVRSGADGICAISTVLGHDDIAYRVQQIIQGVKTAKQEQPVYAAIPVSEQ